ncbi:MAG: recF [Gammaproteobacteria bacterium]|jgi:DNA replication and repair protein RecF|nr:recF [Gammaproteobacteria bacterium]
MGLSLLAISEFRNLVSINLQPVTDGFNFIYGKNGSGKTSLLEAIYYLSLGRSFRSTHTDCIVRHSASKLSIFGRIITLPPQYATLGLERHLDGKTKFKINGEEASSITELASLIPVQLIDSSCHNLLDSGPLFRRKYLDFGLFYQTNDFLRIWRRYERALKQRNAALRSQVPRKDLIIWTHELINSATQLDQLRFDYVKSIVPLLIKTAAELLPIFDLKITYQRGWELSRSYDEALLRTIDKDYQLGYTQIGPHKADLKILINDIPAKDILSRGQQKLFVCAMILARGTLLQSYENKTPIYLVDDLPSELDIASRSSLISLLSKQKAQVFVTATEKKAWSDFFIDGIPRKMFHVEHGYISEINKSEVE